MKKMRCLASLLAIIMLIMTCNTGTAYAYETQPQGKITIASDVEKTGIALEGKIFHVYKVLDATITKAEPGTKDDNITYTVNDYYKEFFVGKTIIRDSQTVTIEADSETFDHDAQEYIHEQEADMVKLVAEIRQYTIDKNITPAASADGTVAGSVVGGTLSTPLLNPGYYMVLDAADTGKVEDGTAAMQGALGTVPKRESDGSLTGDMVINIKASVPTIEKEIWHNDIPNTDGDSDPEHGTDGSWDQVGDYQIGDTVEFLIKTTVPSDIDAYDTYTYVVKDELSAGLKLNIDNTSAHKGIQVYEKLPINGQPVPGGLHTTTISESGNGFVLDFNMKGIVENFVGLTEFYIYYTATVTEDAEIANGFETNTVTLEYSNNPYDESSKGKDESTVYSYTFDMNITKTEGDKVTGLDGAVFALYEVTTVNDKKVEKQIYLEEKGVVDGVVIYYPTTATANDEVSDENNGVGTIVTRTESGVTGKFQIIGLDDATEYKLAEIKAPAGFNKAKPIYFKINAEYTKDPVTGIPRPTVTVGGDVVDQNVTVVNTSSTLLPETGGMGTTIFVVLGQVLMGIAFMAFIMRRKSVIK